MSALVRVIAVVFMAVVPGGLALLCAFILARLIAARVRAQSGPHRFSQAFANLSFRDVLADARRSLS